MNPSELLNFTNKTILVTGASGGIGQGIALHFAQAGAAVIVHYGRNKDGAQQTVKMIEDMSGTAYALSADLTDEISVKQLFSDMQNHVQQIDILINNAGIYPMHNIMDMSVTDWDAVMNANMRSVFLCTQAFAQQAPESASIVNIASIEATHPALAHSHYNASKGALIMFTKSSALELGEKGIRVNAVSPGLINRDGLEEAWADGVQRYRNQSPLSTLGTPTDVANACLFLTSSMAQWITGINLVVDGGVSSSPIF